MAAGTNGTVVLSQGEVERRLEAEARRRGQRSAGVLIRSYRRGTLRDPGAFADLFILASLLPRRHRCPPASAADPARLIREDEDPGPAGNTAP